MFSIFSSELQQSIPVCRSKALSINQTKWSKVQKADEISPEGIINALMEQKINIPPCLPVSLQLHQQDNIIS